MLSEEKQATQPNVNVIKGMLQIVVPGMSLLCRTGCNPKDSSRLLYFYQVKWFKGNIFFPIQITVLYKEMPQPPLGLLANMKEVLLLKCSPALYKLCQLLTAPKHCRGGRDLRG